METGTIVYDRALAKRVRQVLAGQPAVVEKAMFGGIGFLMRGNMCCGIHKDDLVVRVGPERYENALAKPNAQDFDLTGRPMKGWVVVAGRGVGTAEALQEWVSYGLAYAQTLPPK